MSIEESVRSVIEPLANIEDVEIVDIEHKGATLRITVDQQPDGIGTEALARVTRAISRAMDEHDPVAGRYTLEVSSPGLERPLRTPDHFRRACGETIKIKTSVEVRGRRRFQGELLEVNDQSVLIDLDEPLPPDRGSVDQTVQTVQTDGADSGGDEPVADESLRLEYHQIDKARTVFEWGPAPKPGSPEAKTRAQRDARKKKKKLAQQQASQGTSPEPVQDLLDDPLENIVEEPQGASTTDHKSENTGAVGS